MFTQARKKLSTVDSTTWKEGLKEGKKGKKERGKKEDKFSTLQKKSPSAFVLHKAGCITGFLRASLLLGIVVGHCPEPSAEEDQRILCSPM